MPLFRFQVQNVPSPPAERGGSADGGPSMMPPTPSSQLSSSPEAYEESSPKGRWRQNRRRGSARGPPRNTEKRPYHLPTHVSPPHDKPMTKNDIYFALDCEMVGVGPEGLESAVARVTICNWAEQVVLDTFVKVPVEVTDYRTFVSGIEAKDLEGDSAMELAEVRKMVKNVLGGKILIGHALENDLAALQITHPWHDTRDTASYPPFMKKGEADATVLLPRKLKELVRDKLGSDIQTLGEAHDPVEDAKAALNLYKSDRMEWEKYVMKQVASARTKEGRESEPSGRGSPPSPPQLKNGYGPPVVTTSVQVNQQNANYNQAYPMYHRSRSAPMMMMTPHQGYDHRAYGMPPPRQVYYHQQQSYY